VNNTHCKPWPRIDWVLDALLKGTSVMDIKGEKSTVHSLLLPELRIKPATFALESLTIMPRLALRQAGKQY